MAGASLLTLLDDIASLLDDVAILSKVAVKKTAGVLGDDLAVNAEQVSGVKADRELPVIWAVAKGSFKNKFILVPSALAISALIPWLITPLLLCGACFLCFEGIEKISHWWRHRKLQPGQKSSQAQSQTMSKAQVQQFEQEKIKGAIRTDFILSAEIVVIALGTVQNQSLQMQAIVVATIAILITVCVYGLVALIVKIDDLGLWMLERGRANDNSLNQSIGQGLLNFAPWLMKSLSVIGTIAMFLVGGGIFSHGIPWLHHLSNSQADAFDHLPTIEQFWGPISPVLFNFGLGILVGTLVYLVYLVSNRIRGAAH
ncbi:DUF808 domain-containing protein [Alginatibacterium sediminis]|uniref:DUF808 domain-containing protein n=1 Tax=Alginatibacterium sediminis TaxID=2164068 RepID=A0A420E6E6_9ALTE|nr:DUF808 domain-containing protein [Alginatibacterium sediminis]RKF13237.1 DUF808 domain-containing protein [Alginatibacterium sediminis]